MIVKETVLFQWDKQHELNLYTVSCTVEAKINIMR